MFQLGIATGAAVVRGGGIRGVFGLCHRQREAGPEDDRCGRHYFQQFHLISGVGGWLADCWELVEFVSGGGSSPG